MSVSVGNMAGLGVSEFQWLPVDSRLAYKLKSSALAGEVLFGIDADGANHQMLSEPITVGMDQRIFQFA
ncbi:MAG: hypothetical protein JKX83_09770 [Pseudomonadales bacterium]|nr:hypothetical protein [Pseudomonadales bacterium]